MNMQPTLTAKQLRAIRAGVTKLGWDDAEYRLHLSRYRVTTGGDRHGKQIKSTKELSRQQARNVLAGMSILGYHVGGPYSGHRPPDPQANSTLPTKAQRALIDRLVADVPWRTRLGYDAWLLSPTSPTRGKPVRTYADAEAVIEGLKSILRHAQSDHHTA